jgi:predicted amidohydrolase
MRLACLLLSAAICLPAVAQNASRTVRVAALQCYSRLGETASNTSNLLALVREAAAGGAKVMVTPECALQGYMYTPNMITWSTNAESKKWHVSRVAETIPGASTTNFAKLARELEIYLCLGMIERANGNYYNSQVLFAPDGAIAAHHRKQQRWPPGDGPWCSQGDLPLQVVETPYGRLGLMICYDFQSVPKRLAQKKPDIVLYSVGWYGPHPDEWFKGKFCSEVVKPNGFHVVLANWSTNSRYDNSPGKGASSIFDNRGTCLAMATNCVSNAIVYADLPLPQK